MSVLSFNFDEIEKYSCINKDFCIKRFSYFVVSTPETNNYKYSNFSPNCYISIFYTLKLF